MKGALHTSFVDARGRQVAWGSTWPGSDFLFGAMRGFDSKQSSMFCLRSPETVVPADHPLRGIKKRVDAALAQLSPAFDAMYAGKSRAAPIHAYFAVMTARARFISEPGFKTKHGGDRFILNTGFRGETHRVPPQ